MSIPNTNQISLFFSIIIGIFLLQVMISCKCSRNGIIEVSSGFDSDDANIDTIVLEFDDNMDRIIVLFHVYGDSVTTRNLTILNTGEQYLSLEKSMFSRDTNIAHLNIFNKYHRPIEVLNIRDSLAKDTIRIREHGDKIKFPLKIWLPPGDSLQFKNLLIATESILSSQSFNLDLIQSPIEYEYVVLGSGTTTSDVANYGCKIRDSIGFQAKRINVYFNLADDNFACDSIAVIGDIRQNTLAHELCHVLGLCHSGYYTNLMFRVTGMGLNQVIDAYQLFRLIHIDLSYLPYSKYRCAGPYNLCVSCDSLMSELNFVPLDALGMDLEQNQLHHCLNLNHECAVPVYKEMIDTNYLQDEMEFFDSMHIMVQEKWNFELDAFIFSRYPYFNLFFDKIFNYAVRRDSLENVNIDLGSLDSWLSNNRDRTIKALYYKYAVLYYILYQEKRKITLDRINDLGFDMEEFKKTLAALSPKFKFKIE